MRVPWPASQVPSKAAGTESGEASERQPVWGARGLRASPVLSGGCTKECTLKGRRAGSDRGEEEGARERQQQVKKDKSAAIKCRGSVSLQAPGTPRAVSTSEPRENHVKPPEGEVSELKPEKLVGISQVKGGEWHLPKSQGNQGS